MPVPSPIVHAGLACTSALLLACIAMRPFIPLTSHTPPPPAGPEPAPSPTPRPSPVPPPACRVEPPPTTVTPPPPDACVPVPAALQRRLRASLASDFVARRPGATLVTQFDCDPLAAPAELDYERGHGGDAQHLRLVRLRWRPDAVDVLSIGLQRSMDDPDLYALSVQRGVLPQPAVSRALPDVRAALLARPDEAPPPDEHGATLGVGAAHHWHARVRLVDRAGRALEHGFTGYDADRNQLTRLPVSHSTARIDAALADIRWEPAAVDDDARAYFVARFLATVPARELWVSESMVRLAAELGTPALVPALIALARDDDPRDSHRRLRTHTLAALAALTGLDARRDQHGRDVPEAIAADRYARACASPQGVQAGN